MQNSVISTYERRRAAPNITQIRPGKGASCSAIRRFEQQCRESGIKLTGLRRLIFHGIFEAEPQATVKDIWQTIDDMVVTYAPTLASVQRTLNVLLQHGFLWRVIGEDRIFRYSLAEPCQKTLPILFVEAQTGREMNLESSDLVVDIRKLFKKKNVNAQKIIIEIDARKNT